eukprot:CAMPEP_0198656520 /NCGR_PEP_ID=MMETSP1467-20131203/9961_1 /TAXON_ID=1462469 /ORGANISM="unid. sp., Strain CCMP2135" /LENGTH=118 /DNA_ID=CAMNT_0044392563 /DNA_START=71 /DNA_END=427 /DNA_ORIENTATION=-
MTLAPPQRLESPVGTNPSHCAAVCALVDAAEARAKTTNFRNDWCDLRAKLQVYPLGLDDLDWLTDDDLHYFVPPSVRAPFGETLKLWQRRDAGLVRHLREASPHTVDEVLRLRRSWSS